MREEELQDFVTQEAQSVSAHWCSELAGLSLWHPINSVARQLPTSPCRHEVGAERVVAPRVLRASSLVLPYLDLRCSQFKHLMNHSLHSKATVLEGMRTGRLIFISVKPQNRKNKRNYCLLHF